MSTALSRKIIAGPMAIDAYKLGHADQYPEGTELVYSNLTPRTSRIPGVDRVVFFGLQAAIDKLEDLFEGFFLAYSDDVKEAYAERVKGILGVDEVNTDRIVALHKLGFLPLEFRALPEGTHVPLRVPFFTVHNTLPEFYWLVNYIETYLSAELWQPTTSATLAMRLRELLDGWAVTTTGSTEGVAFQGHDFSFRGMAGIEAASASGAGHLVAFTGTDTLPALDFIDEHYYGNQSGFLGGSVFATEHSVMCAGGDQDELGTFKRLLDIYPTGILSVVSDTWDLWKVLTEYLPALRADILGRDGKLVIRPDSGDPVDIICGPQELLGWPQEEIDTDRWEARTPAEKGVIELLWEVFGGTENEQGYRVLDPHIGAIYGDSITYERADEICRRLAEKGFASTNIVFGVGSYTYQYQTRDTFGMAMKATYAVVNGEPRELFKDPITDNGGKRSARGLLQVVEDDKLGLKLIDRVGWLEARRASKLKTIYRDGAWVKRHTFADVRETARRSA